MYLVDAETTMSLRPIPLVTTLKMRFHFNAIQKRGRLILN